MAEITSDLAQKIQRKYSISFFFIIFENFVWIGQWFSQNIRRPTAGVSNFRRDNIAGSHGRCTENYNERKSKSIFSQKYQRFIS